jgi:hypothetical protein
LKKIKDLIVVKEVGETTLSLLREIKFHQKETVENYIFTDSIREHFDKILDSIVSGRGGGFWVQAEYGAGKTHFIAALACLLMDTSETLWSRLQDPQIRNYRFKLDKTKLFPVIINLKGEASVGDNEENLLRIVERHIGETAEEQGLKDKISIATADEMVDWYKNCSQDLRNAIDSFIRQAGGDPKKTSQEQLAKFISNYCEKEKITPKISATTKDRVKNIYDQLLKNGYDGMLFVIDEFAARQMRHTEQSSEYAADEEVLETLAWVLPKDLRLNIYIIVASHLPAPTKLKEDRFKTINLLADRAAKEYDIIVSKRIREIVEARTPEIEQYYQFYLKNFSFLKKLDKEYFFSIFPFHPQCFEAIRNITKRELPTARSGINILHDILAHGPALEKDSLLTVSDLLIGLHPARELETHVYQKSYKSYRSALDGLVDIDFDLEDTQIAQKVLNALFLWNLAYLETPKHLSIQQLAEMELVHSDIVKGSDLVETVMIKLRDLPQIEYIKEKGAAFIVTGEQAIRPAQVLSDIKKKLSEQEFKINDCWEKSLVFSPEQTGGSNALFSGYSFDQRSKVVIGFQKIEYPGEIVVARDWRPEYGESLREDVHFRLVLLSRNIKFDLKGLKDKRIGVCVPGSFNDSAKQAALNYLAITEMENVYASKNDPEAEEIRQWIKTKKREHVNALLETQLPLFADGKIYTQQSLAIDEKKVFASESLDRIFNAVVNSLLYNAYQSPLFDSTTFKKNFSGNDAKKIFDGFFRRGAGPAAFSACENFAPGLNLSKSTSPRAFNAEGNAIFGFFKKRLEENDYDVPVWKLYMELCAPPYGVVRDVITLNLLCFVRYGDPGVELRLKDAHRQPIKGSRITTFNVPEIDWRGRFEDDFDLLSRSTEVSWNDVLPLARIVAPEQDLKTATKPEDIMEQEKRLLLSFNNILDKASSVSANLGALWNAFERKFPYLDCVENVKKICNTKNYSDFKETITEVYAQNLETFKSDFETFRNLIRLSEQATTILGSRSYLDQAILPAEKASLCALKVTIQDQLNPESFVKDLAKLEKIKKQFEEFKRQYTPIYQIHHREYYGKLDKARHQLEEAAARIDVIARLNKLNMNLIPSKTAYSDLLIETKACKARDPINVDSLPICRDCKLILTRKYEEKEINAILAQLDESVQQGIIGLRQMLTKPVLDLDKEKRLAELLKAIQSDDAKLFVKAFSEPTVEYLARLFEKANIETINLSISGFVQEHAFVEEDGVEDIVEAFRNTLVKTIEKAKKQKPGKKIRIALGE